VLKVINRGNDMDTDLKSIIEMRSSNWKITITTPYIEVQYIYNLFELAARYMFIRIK